MSEQVVLNPQQSAAVTVGDGPVLVLAGAGTGKTRVIVERIVWLIRERGVDPRNILAMTFTNRAANEMKQRAAARLGVERLATFVGTFHSFALLVLRREIERLHYPARFTVFDETDQVSLMRRLVRELPPEYVKVTPREALHWISRIKQDTDAPDLAAPALTDEEETYRRLWTQYHAGLRAASALDFDDLLVLLVKLLDEFPDVREKYQRRYKQVLVDEYQDTNHAQYRIVRRLTEDKGNVFVVGDEDQSIYSWRGANLRNILDFQKDFDNAQVIRLEQNYRSAAPILEAAGAIVANNQDRLGKTLFTKQQGGEGVRFYLANNAEDEARFVVDDLVQAKEYKTTGILYRTNAQARLVEESLLRRGINYTVVGSVRFYSRKEIKDLLCYMRLLVNASDDEALRRAVNVPPRGIGETTMLRLTDYAKERQMPLMQVMREIEHDQTIQPRTRTAIAGFIQLIDDLELVAKTSEVAALVEALLERTRYLEYLKASDEKDFRSRQEVVGEFISACASFDRKRAGGVSEFLQELALMSDQDELDLYKEPPAVTLLTCHSAKGLEFDAVYLIGLEEGLLPHAISLDSKRDIEEERRLCYVAMTRARKRLTLTAAKSRVLQGHDETRAVSRFVKEIPGGSLDFLMGGKPPAAKPKFAGSGGGVPSGPSAPGPAAIKTGTKVRHPRFGKGHVLYTTGSGDGMRARIRFDTGRVGTFMVSQTPLEIEGKK